MENRLRELLTRFAYTDPMNLSEGDIDQAEKEIREYFDNGHEGCPKNCFYRYKDERS